MHPLFENREIGEIPLYSEANIRDEMCTVEGECLADLQMIPDVHLTPKSVVNMEPIAHLVKVSVPNYLSGLPIPDTIGGWFRLGVRDWISLIPPTALLAGIGYMSYKAFCPKARQTSSGKINQKIDKSCDKVVNFHDVEDITEKVAFCRCWKSENWPYCDGAHGRHNKDCKDNVGPLVITKKK